MKNKLNWNIFSDQDRNKTINDLKVTISSSGGFIVNSNFFSDLALSLTVEIEEKDIARLYSKLNETMSIEEVSFENMSDTSVKEWWIFLNITFVSGKGDLKIEVPEVPGMRPTGHAGTMVGDGDELQACIARGGSYLRCGGVRVTGGQGVRVEVCKKAHG